MGNYAEMQANKDLKKMIGSILIRVQQHLPTAPFIPVNDKMERSMDEECKCGLIVPAMKVCGRTIKLMAWEPLSTQMVTYMKECGSTIKPMDMELTSTQMEQLM